MRDLLKVEPNGCLRLRLKSLISFIVIWLLRKFERTWECEKKEKKSGFNDLCYLNLGYCNEKHTSTKINGCVRVRFVPSRIWILEEY